MGEVLGTLTNYSPQVRKSLQTFEQLVGTSQRGYNRKIAWEQAVDPARSVLLPPLKEAKAGEGASSQFCVVMHAAN